MFTKSLFAPALALVGLPSMVIAADCQLVGYTRTAQAGWGIGGTTTTAGGGMKIYRDGEEYWTWEPEEPDGLCIDCYGICVDQEIDPDDDNLKTFYWTPDCGSNDLDACTVKYDGEELEGDTSDENDFYGLGISDSQQCVVEFEC